MDKMTPSYRVTSSSSLYGGDPAGRVVVGTPSYRYISSSTTGNNGAHHNTGTSSSRARPAWNSDIKDQSIYRLSRSEMLRRQAALSTSHYHAFHKSPPRSKKVTKKKKKPTQVNRKERGSLGTTVALDSFRPLLNLPG